MAINFPNSPSDGATHTDGSIDWVYSSANNSWTVTSGGSDGVENATNHDKEVVILTRASSKNILTTAVGLLFDKSARTLTLKGALSQTANMVEIQNSVGTVLNSFNARGVLDAAGRVYYQSSTPAPNALDTGLLWYNTTDSNLYVWSGTAWVIAAGGVTLSGNQTITGAKTFSADITLSSSAKIKGSGASKTIIFQPTSSLSVPTTSLTLSDTGATVAGQLDYATLGTAAKAVTCTLGDDQTITGAKVFSANIQILNQIITDTGTAGNAASPDLTLRPNLSLNGRYITIHNNGNTANGITIKAKNSNNNGGLTLDSNVSVTGNLAVTGTLTTTTPLAAATMAVGSFKANGTLNPTYNIDSTPSSLGPLTITSYLVGTTTKSVTILNSSTTAPITFYFRRDQVNSSGNPCYTVHKVTLTASGTITILGQAGTATGTGYTYTPVSGSYNTSSFSLTTNTNQPITYTITLGN